MNKGMERKEKVKEAKHLASLYFWQLLFEDIN
jgi:hypothetical protein